MRAVEGRQVNLRLVDGTRLQGCSVVSVGRLWARTVWLLSGETDLFVKVDEVDALSVPERREAA